MIDPVTRTPLYFGESGRRLFGWHHAAARGSARDLAVVICPPLGHEYVSAHRAVRHLADRFAAAGVESLRFDYDGTGDALGSDEDPCRVSAWCDSIDDAIRTLRRRAEGARIVLAGLRMGATLAALAASEHEVDAMVLWGPCVRGRAYVRELRALHLTGGNRYARTDNDSIEPGGFVVTAETQRELSALALNRVRPNARRVLVVTPDDVATDARPWAEWRAAGLQVETRSLPGFRDIFVLPHNTIVPRAAIDEIVAWTVRGAGTRSAAATDSRMSQASAEALSLCGGDCVDPRLDIRERIVRVSSDPPVVGVLSEPLERSGSSRPVLVMPNAGAAHHVGPNRLYVLLARELARAGFRCLRFDLPGLGDNITEHGEHAIDPYVEHAGRAVHAAASAALQVATRGGASTDRAIVLGLCSGAHTAFHAALELPDAPIVECVLVNPLTFYYKPGMPLDQAASSHYEEWQRYMRSVRSLDGWRKLLRDDVRLAAIGATVVQRFAAIGRNRTRGIRRRLAPNRAASRRRDDLDRDVRQIVAAGRRLTFVFSRFDPGYDLLMINARRAVRRHRKSGDVRVWRIDEANHTFEARHSRDEMIRSVTRHLMERYPA
jgi:alpha-beta hydrolase superfamily lysophospholipase